MLARIREHGSFTDGEMIRLIIQLSVPSVLAQITSTLLFFIDAAMVGSLGAEASASIGIIESTTWLFGSLTGAAAMGFSVQVAHKIGANDFSGARAVLRQAILITIAFALMLASVGLSISPFLPRWLGGGEDIVGLSSVYFAIYASVMPFYQLYNLSASMLKCSGNMKIPSVISIVMCVLDAIFNFLLIFVAGLGVAGAAIGTGLSIVICSCITAWFAFVRSDILRLSHEPGRWRPTREVVVKALKVSVPMAAQHMLMNGAQIVSTLIIAPLGTIAIATHSLAITAESLCYMPAYGIGEAATTLVGQCLGACERTLARGFAYKAVGSGMVLMVFMGFVMYVFAPEMIGVMSPVEAIRELGTEVLRIEAWAEPMFASAIICYSCFVGAGDTLKPASINLATMWGVRLTLAALLATGYGLQGVWFAMAVELSLRGFLLLVRLYVGHWDKAIKK